MPVSQRSLTRELLNQIMLQQNRSNGPLSIATYSDCEHEVLEVTRGHRVTLTYNLYFALGRDDLAGISLAMDVQSLPLY
jgi:hypothetical protein